MSRAVGVAAEGGAATHGCRCHRSGFTRCRSVNGAREVASPIIAHSGSSSVSGLAAEGTPPHAGAAGRLHGKVEGRLTPKVVTVSGTETRGSRLLRRTARMIAASFRLGRSPESGIADQDGAAEFGINRTGQTYYSRLPILHKESDFFPEDLFDMPTEDAPWEIAHLRSRQEKSVARLLMDGGKPFYLPQVKQTKKRSGRTFVSHLPLFQGYIFLRRVEGLRQTLWRTSAVVKMLEVPDQEQLTAELLQIRRLQASGALLTPCADLAAGDAVRITEGAFSGYAGIVMEERGSMRLIVSVSVLRKSVAVEFPRELLAQLKRGGTGRDGRRT
jgi:transcriptional antiterminator NusG